MAALNPQSPPVAKSKRVLACVLCQHRKIKCDRQFPCANCVKANVQCTPSTPAPARKRRRPNQDLQERLARCENLLKEYATEKPESTVPQQQAKLSLYEDSYMTWQPAGKLVKEDGGTRFMDNFLLGTIYDELKAMREIVDADDNDDTAPGLMTPDDNSDLLLGAESTSQNLEDLWPEPSQILRLWQIFLDRVNPLTKVIHVPTLQPYLAEATTDRQNIPRNVESLLFSIFLMAVVSSTPEECHSLLGMTRERALQKFSEGVRATLLRMGFLKSNDLTTLQALVIYLISLQGRYNRHAAWILNGVVIRIAQKMGLHRDGEDLGLRPFESEMRRRLWWQIILLDTKYALLSGLGHSLLPRNWDTKLPKNLNDADIYPTASEPFPDREGPTEMIFVLMLCKIVNFMVRTPGLESMILAAEPGTTQARQEKTFLEYRSAMEQLSKELVLYIERYCDASAGPIHEMTVMLKTHIFDKLQETLTAQRELPESGDKAKVLKDNAFRVALSHLEHNANNYMTARTNDFLWFSLLHFQPEVLMFLAGQLCRRTQGSLVERAWKQIDIVYDYHTELMDLSNKTYFTIAVFVLKAWNSREDFFRSQEIFLSVPSYINRLRHAVPDDDIKTQSTPTEPSTMTLVPDFPLMSPQPVVPVPSMDQIWNGYMDVSSFEWNIFGNFGAQPQQSASLAGFGMPTTEW